MSRGGRGGWARGGGGGDGSRTTVKIGGVDMKVTSHEGDSKGPMPLPTPQKLFPDSGFLYPDFSDRFTVRDRWYRRLGYDARARANAENNAPAGLDRLQHDLDFRTSLQHYIDSSHILFPQLDHPAVFRPPSLAERRSVEKYKLFRQELHKGPLYTVLGGHVRVGKGRAVPKKVADGFDNMASFPKAKVMAKRKIPRLDTRPYVAKFFPMELRDLLDPEAAKENGTNGVAKPMRRKKLFQIADDEYHSRVDQLLEEDAARREDGAADDRADDDDDAEEEDEEDKMEDEVDDNYEDDEDEGYDDYNAEQYFDGGDGDDDNLGYQGGGAEDDYGDF